MGVWKKVIRSEREEKHLLDTGWNHSKTIMQNDFFIN